MGDEGGRGGTGGDEGGRGGPPATLVFSSGDQRDRPSRQYQSMGHSSPLCLWVRIC